MGVDLLAVDIVFGVEKLDGKEDLGCVEFGPKLPATYISSFIRLSLRMSPKSSPPGQYSST